MSLIIFIIISLCIGCWVWKQRNRFILNSDSLHKQWLFRLAIAFPLISSVYFIVWLGAPYPFRFDSYGYNAFLEINKFPLGILALSPILGAFVVYAHRSLQTEKQIKTAENQLIEAQKKNKVDVYYATRRFMHDQLEKIKTAHNEHITNPTLLYLKVYKQNGNHSDEKINTLYNEINKQLEGECFTNDILKDINSIELLSLLDENTPTPSKKQNLTHHIISLDCTLSHMKESLLISVENRLFLFDKFQELLESIKKTNGLIKLNIHNQDKIAIFQKEKNVKCYLFIVAVYENINSILEAIHTIITILNPADDIDKIMPLLKERKDSISMLYSTLNRIDS